MKKLLSVESKELNYKAYLSIDTLNHGLAFGGCRFSPSVTAAEVQQLSECMTLKLLPHGLPVGGAKGGFCIDPKSPQILDAVQHFARELQSYLKETVILGKDLGATDEIMDALYAGISSPQMSPVIRKFPNTNVPTRLRELAGYQKNMTGKGVAWATSAFFKGSVVGKRVLIQGAGAVGVGTAVRLTDMGAIVVGISDKDHCLYSQNGIGLDVIMSSVVGGVIDAQKVSSGIEVWKSEELFSKPADILILAASSHTVSVPMVKKLKCQLVVEGSNFGLLPDARNYLFTNGMPMVPDIIASSSSAAMVAHQMATGNGYSDETLWLKIETAIRRTTEAAVIGAKEHNLEVKEFCKLTFGETYGKLKAA